MLWRERVGDDRVSPAAIVAGVLAPALGASALLLCVGVLLVVCISRLLRYSVGGLLRWLAVVGVRGRERHRRVLGIHCRLVGAAVT